MGVSFKRIVRSGWVKFLRDRSSTGAALTVMIATLFVISALFVLHGISSFLITELQESVDVSVYFKDSAVEEDIFGLRQELLRMDEVVEAKYVSKEEAFEQFVETHRDDNVLLEPLAAIGRNPFLASINIKAKSPEDFSSINAFLSDESFASIVESIDFHDRAPVIEQINLVTTAIRVGVLIVITILSVIAVLVAFNTIRLTIYNSREEIEVMRLVGASNWFIRGPFLVQGILVGIVASIITMALLIVTSLFIADEMRRFTGFEIIPFLGSEILFLLLVLVVCGIGLGLVSSTIAIRRYLKV